MIRDLGECSIPLPLDGTAPQRICAKTLGTAKGICASSEWKVSQVIIGYSDVLSQPNLPTSEERYQPLRVHWIRLNKRN